jgi:predicted tellurium resistance membrane protein TerC
MEVLLDPTVIGAILTLTLLEIVLGVDNIIFIAIMSDNLAEHKRASARRIGLIGASVSRIVFLCFAGWILSLESELFTVFAHSVSGHDIVLIIGGLFLLAKAIHEIYERTESDDEHTPSHKASKTLASVIVQIMIMDFVFSIDSVITAVGMTDLLWVMITAVVLSVSVMLIAVGAVSRFIERHPSVKVVALSFLVLIGTMLIAQGLGQHIPKGYIYFAMGFSAFVQTLDILTSKRHHN